MHLEVIHVDGNAPAEKPTNLSLLAAAAGFLFSFRAAFVLISARWLNIGTEPGVLAGFAMRASLMIVFLIAAFGGNSHCSSRLFKERTFQWMILYALFTGCSVFWSAAASPASSAVYWCGTAGDVVTVVLLARSSGAVSAALSLMKGFVAGTLVVAVMAWVMPAAEDLRLGDPDYFNTNQVANLCAFALLMCSLLARYREDRWMIPAFFLGLTLIRSLSKATVIAFIAAQAYRLTSDHAMSAKRKCLLVFGAVVVTLCFWGLLDSYFDIYTSADNQAETLTGRTGIWLWALDAGLNRPIAGNGFDAMWKVAPPFGGELFEARHTENEVLQQFFAYGLCGVALLIGVYGNLYRRFRRLVHSSDRSILISFLVFVVVRGLAEAEPFDLLLPLWLMTVLLCLIEPHQVEQQSVSTQTEHVDGASVVPAV